MSDFKYKFLESSILDTNSSQTKLILKIYRSIS